jgi:hypothetical protein
VRPLPNEPYQPESEDVRAKHQELVATMKKLFEAQPLYVEQLRHVRSADFQVRAYTHSPCCACLYAAHRHWRAPRLVVAMRRRTSARPHGLIHIQKMTKQTSIYAAY